MRTMAWVGVMLAWVAVGVLVPAAALGQMSAEDALQLLREKEAAQRAAATQPGKADAGAAAAAQPAGPATQPAAAHNTGPYYYLIDIKGEIGVEVKADTLRQALRAAKGNGAEYAVLSLDTAGGAFAEAVELMHAIKEASAGMKVVAYVRRAWGAGALVALASPQIVMAPEGMLGAPPAGLAVLGATRVGNAPGANPRIPRNPANPANPVKPGAPAPDAAPVDPAAPSPEAQFQTAVEMEQGLIVEKNHHEALLVAGMYDAQRELTLTADGGQPKVVEASDARAAGGKPLKAKGKLLCLPAPDAKATGLALGIAPSEDAICELLGLPGWRKAGSAAALMALKAREGRRKAYLDSIAPRLLKLEADLAQVQAQGKMAEQALAETQQARDQERLQVMGQYRGMINSAPGDLRASQAYANFLSAKQAEVDARYAPKLGELAGTCNRLALEQRRILAERQALLDAAPK